MSPFDFDWIVIGSGFGGSVAALRLTEKGYRVAVVEQGRRFEDEDFASNAWQARRLLWAPRLGLRGVMRVRTFKHVTVLAGVGVGGGSLVYGNTLYVPHSNAFYEHPQWAEIADWRQELAPHYAEAERMLGVATYQGEGASEQLMRSLASDLGVADSYRSTPVGVFFGTPGESVEDPYFGGSGPARTGCARCGQCMLGCRYGAKNTLVKNYLWHAEAGGASIHSERVVTAIRPLGCADGSDGYTLSTQRSGAWWRHGRCELTTRGVVVCGGPLGTNELLRRCKDHGFLPRISDRLGELVRTNREAITAATARGDDYRGAVAITASIYPDAHTHVTNNTYGAGGDALALNFGPLTSGARPRLRPLLYFAAVARRPIAWLRPGRTRGWSRRSIIFTVMQSHESSLRLRPVGRRRRLQTEADAGGLLGAYLPVANRIAELAAGRMGGTAQSSVAESLTGVPTTAHFLGGAVIGADRFTGVVDVQHRVFGYQNLLVCDGAAVPANVGVNPSLTIAALAERDDAHSRAPGVGAARAGTMSKRTSDFFKGRSVLLTGGSSGLGLALARALAAREAQLMLVARDDARLTAAAQSIAARHPACSLRTAALDVSDPAALSAAFAATDRVDVLINCAGILKEGYFETLPETAFREVMEVNYFGVLNVIRATLAQLRRTRGRIVNIASAAGLSGVFGYTAYCAAKHALIGFSDALGYELRPHGITVHTVCPGEFDSPMVRALDRTRTPENRAHTLTIPKTSLQTLVRDTLHGVERGQTMILPGALARGAIRSARVAPGLTRKIGDRRIAAARGGARTGTRCQSRDRPSDSTNPDGSPQ